MGHQKDASGNPVSASPKHVLGRDSFRRTDDGTELMNVNGLAQGTKVVLWNGTGAGDSGGDWTASGTGSETAGSKHAGTNGWDTGVMTEDQSVVFNNGSMIDVDGTYDELLLWINPQAFPVTSRPRLAWLNGSDVRVGNALRVDDYAQNMDLGVWQQVAIPIADFALTGNVQKLRLQAKNTAGQDYWLDDIRVVASSGGGPHRFRFAAPTGYIYHVRMVVLEITGPANDWESTAFGTVAGGLTNGLVARQRLLSTSEVLWKFVAKSNLPLFGMYHPQEDVAFSDDVRLFGFMIKPGGATVEVTDDEVLEFVVRDDLSDLTDMRAYAHYGTEQIS